MRVSSAVAGGNLLFKHDEAELLNTQSEALERLKKNKDKVAHIHQKNLICNRLFRTM